MKSSNSPAEYYQPDLARLREIAAKASPADHGGAVDILRQTGERLPLEHLAALLKAVVTGSRSVIRALCDHSAELRRSLFGDTVIPMAPVEVSNTCSSDCLFCGWRVSNSAMKRMRIPTDLALLQADYLVGLGIHHIEFVSGDDVQLVRRLLPGLIRGTREIFDKHGVHGRISFCTLALTEKQYRQLHNAGADAMIVWQEAYDPEVFKQHVKCGPKASGIRDGWDTVPDGDGCAFRVQSQERAMRAGLQVALGSMLGLNPDICTEFLATVDHARFLADRYGCSAEQPMIIGMPIWNPITTRTTDLRPSSLPDLAAVFPALAALYLLALPSEGTWVFPNCRVPMRTQIEAARVAGVFTSTEVKLGPGGYLPAIIRSRRAAGENPRTLEKRIATILREAGQGVEDLARMLDEREQFAHHYHSHDVYAQEMEKAGLHIAASATLPEHTAHLGK